MISASIGGRNRLINWRAILTLPPCSKIAKRSPCTIGLTNWFLRLRRQIRSLQLINGIVFQSVGDNISFQDIDRSHRKDPRSWRYGKSFHPFLSNLLGMVQETMSTLIKAFFVKFLSIGFLRLTRTWQHVVANYTGWHTKKDCRTTGLMMATSIFRKGRWPPKMCD